jgi:KDO2-lipid IV(A) lauroyltransferase
LKKFLYPIYALPLYGLSLLPFPLLYLLSDGLRFLAFNIIGYRKKVVYENLRNAFHTYTEAEIDVIAKKFYKHFACGRCFHRTIFNLKPIYLFQ